MTEYKVDFNHPSAKELEDSFNLGRIPTPDEGGDDEAHLIIEFVTARVNGIKVEIFANEHPPPHFRVKYQGSTANFRICDCALLDGSGEVVKYRRNIKKWWRVNKINLIEVWNERRPADCPVGEYREEAP